MNRLIKKMNMREIIVNTTIFSGFLAGYCKAVYTAYEKPNEDYIEILLNGMSTTGFVWWWPITIPVTAARIISKHGENNEHVEN